MQGGGTNALAFKLARHAVGGVLHAGKHQHAIELGVLPQQVQQEIALLRFSDFVNALVDGGGGIGAATDLHGLRRVQKLAAHLLDFPGKGGRKEQRLALRRQRVNDAFDVGQEAHVEHAVSFVEHEEFEAREIRATLAHQVEQAAGGGDNDIDAGA